MLPAQHQNVSESVLVCGRKIQGVFVDGTSFPDAGSLVTTAQVTREICPQDLK